MKYYRVEIRYSLDGKWYNDIDYYWADSTEEAEKMCQDEYKGHVEDLHIQRVYRDAGDCWTEDTE